MPDSIAGLSDAALIDVSTQTHNAMLANLANYPGVTQQQVNDLKTFYQNFEADLTDQIAKLAASRASTQTKDASRSIDEGQLRLLRNVTKAAGASDAAMAETGMPTGSSKAPSNATVPAAKVNTSERLRHTIEWRDNATPDNKRKPRGAMGVEIWVKIGGPPPGSEKDCIFLTLDAFSPYLAEYDATEAGKTAHYMLRWHMRDGTNGAWGETVSATITG